MEQDSQGTGLIAFGEWLIAFEERVRSQVKPITSSPQEATARPNRGSSTLSWEDLSLDWSLIQKTLDEVLVASAHHFPSLADCVEDLRAAIQNLLLAQRVVKACYKGRSFSLATAKGKEGRMQREVLRLAARAALRPFLCAWRESLPPLVDQQLWRRGACPVCAALPDFSFLDMEQGARWLVCSRCDARWLFQRLQCPYCECDDQASLCYLTDEEQAYRVYLCDRCHNYLKAMDLRKKNVAIDPAQQRLETLDLDWQAHCQGYRCPESPIWRCLQLSLKNTEKR